MARLCPECGSGKIIITDKDFKCQACGREGEEHELFQAALEMNAVDEALAIAQEVSSNLMCNLGKFAAMGIGAAAMDAGVVSQNDTKSLARICRAGCLGAHKAILDEVEKIGREAQGKRVGGN